MAFEVKIKKWHGVASWTWGAGIYSQRQKAGSTSGFDVFTRKISKASLFHRNQHCVQQVLGHTKIDSL